MIYKRFLRSVVYFAVAALLPSFAAAQVFNGPGFTIADGAAQTATSCSIVPVSGISGSRFVNSVSFNSFSHSWLGDLELRVYPPGTAPPPSTAGTVVISSPPDGTPCDLLGNYRFVDTASQSVDDATGACGDTDVLPAGDYRTSTYGGGTDPGPVTSLTTSFGSLPESSINGDWLVCAFDFATPDGGSVGGTSIEFALVTSASVSLGGRVVDTYGRPVSRATISIVDSSGTSRSVSTNTFGYYEFDNLSAGFDYIVTAAHARYRFATPTVVHSASADTFDLNFVASR